MRRLDVFVMTVALANAAVMLELVRRRQLREKYALLWLAVGVGGVVVVLGRKFLDRVARAAGVEYGASVFFLGAILFLLLVCIHLSWEVSRLEERTRTLAEELALMPGRVDKSGSTGPSVALDPPLPEGRRPA